MWRSGMPHPGCVAGRAVMGKWRGKAIAGKVEGGNGGIWMESYNSDDIDLLVAVTGSSFLPCSERVRPIWWVWLETGWLDRGVGLVWLGGAACR